MFVKAVELHSLDLARSFVGLVEVDSLGLAHKSVELVALHGPDLVHTSYLCQRMQEVYPDMMALHALCP